MNRADRMLAVLRDGREHSREEIEQLSPGGFFLTNNAASDLRKRGFDVQHRVKDGLHTYQLRPSLESPAVEEPGPQPVSLAGDSSAAGRGSAGRGGARPGAAQQDEAPPLEQLALEVPVSTREREAA